MHGHGEDGVVLLRALVRETCTALFVFVGRFTVTGIASHMLRVLYVV